LLTELTISSSEPVSKPVQNRSGPVLRKKHTRRAGFLICERFLVFLSGVTVLLSLTVFSIMVTEMLPKVSDAVPILG